MVGGEEVVGVASGVVELVVVLTTEVLVVVLTTEVLTTEVLVAAVVGGLGTVTGDDAESPELHDAANSATTTPIDAMRFTIRF